MSIRIISFTKKGIELSQIVAKVLDNDDVEVFTKCSFVKKRNTLSRIQYEEDSIGEWAQKQMMQRNTLLFIGACGIAVRAIAPFIVDKLHDSAVLVMDERGNYIVPILSGHMGEANEIAEKIAIKIGAIPVITTATDVNGKFAVDLFAKKNGLHIENRDGIAKVSAKLLAGKEIRMAIEQGHLNKKASIPEEIILLESEIMVDQTADIVITTKARVKGALLTLKPKEYIIGIGCKRGKEEDKINQFILKNLDKLGISVEQIMAVVSIDKKKDELGLVTWCRKQRISFWTYTAEQLQQMEGNFSTSDFVKDKVGVDNVCERASLRACHYGGSLVYKKHAEDGMTIAIAKREWRVGFDEK